MSYNHAKYYMYPYKSAHEYEWANMLGKIALYEPRTFDVNDCSILGRRYTPDFYIKSIDTWIEIKSRNFNNGSHSIVSQLIRANAAVRKYGIKLYLLAGLPSDYDAYLVNGEASGCQHFRSLGLIACRFHPPNYNSAAPAPSNQEQAAPTPPNTEVYPK
jgi:hypothetical protein